jgi:glycosyltransferase involved in cell wall biosynthesis
MEPLISILTPTWNRAAYLERVWRGLMRQTYKRIEWLIADDGSTDNTAAVVHALAGQSCFPVTFIQASTRIGKSRMDNEAVALARGDFVVWNDSDDYLLPQAVEELVQCWRSIPEAERSLYVGVTALCANDCGVISTPLPFAGTFDTSWNDLAERYNVRGDMLFLTRAEALKMHPFPEVDLLIPEGVVWTVLGAGKTRVCPMVLQVKEYGAPNCVSFNGKMEYCRGRAYAMAVTERHLRAYPRPVMKRLWKLITFVRTGLHGEIGVRRQVRMWGDNSSKLLFLMMWPVAWLFAFKDQLQGKVQKTHREFLAASKVVTIKHAQMGCTGSARVGPAVDLK